MSERTLSEVQAEARVIWGEPRMGLEEVAVAAACVLGHLSRQARAQQEGRPVDWEAVAKELGNMALSTVRWIDDLGLSVDECIDLALAAQRRYVEERERG